VVFDDYGTWPGCRKAVDEFLLNQGLHVQLCPAGDGAVYFQVPATGAGGEYWRVETQRYSEPHQRLKRVAAEILAKPGSTLDIGCGPGTLGTLLAAKNISYCGVDIFEQELSYGQYSSFDLSRDSFGNFPFSQRFAWVTVSGVLEYLYEPRIHELLRFIASKLLEPGGAAVVTYTNFSHYSRTPSTFHPRWTTAASPQVFRRWLTRAGFKVVRAYPSYYYIFKRRLSWCPKIWIPVLSTLLGRQIIYVLESTAK
jgi:SAM-dependent methyltransferase